MKIKNALIQYSDELQALNNKYNQNPAPLQCLLTENAQFKVRLPLIGAFSSGKSSLVNALLREQLFPVEVNPETCLPAEVFYHQNEQLRLCNSSGQLCSLTRDQVMSQDYGLALDGASAKWLEVGVPHSVLAQWPEMVLVDMPGWESGIHQHSHAIDNYVHRSGAYCLVVSVDEGNLRESLKRVLAELTLFNKPVVVVLTKCDKRPQEDVDAVAKQIAAEVETVMGSTPLAVVKVSRKKKSIDAFIGAVEQIHALSDDIHHHTVVVPILAQLGGIESTLKVLLNEDDLALEQIEIEQQQYQRELAQLQSQLVAAGEVLESIVPITVDRIIDLFKNRLTAQVDSLAQAALNQGDIEGIVGSTQRLAFTEGLEQEFKPRIRQQIQSLNHINAIDPESFSVDMNYQSTGDSGMLGDILKTVLPMIVTVLTRHPILISLAPIITRLIEGLLSSKEKEFQARQRLEDAKQYVLNSVIPDICTRSRNTVEQALRQSVADIHGQLSQEIEAKASQHREALNRLADERQLGLQQQQYLKAGYQADLNRLRVITTELSGK